MLFTFSVGLLTFMILMLTFLSHRLSSQVDNVSRFLRYLQPTGIEPSLDFLSKTKEAQDFLTALKRTDMSSATVHNYIKSMNRFLEYLTLRLDFQKRDPQLPTNCQRYTKILETLWKTVLKSHDEKTSDSRLMV